VTVGHRVMHEITGNTETEHDVALLLFRLEERASVC
jgi:hypothetical protein